MSYPKVNGYTFKGNNSAIFIFCLPFQRESSVKQNNLPPPPPPPPPPRAEKFFPLSADPILMEFIFQESK